MNLDERKQWKLKRIEKDIRLKPLADYIGCTGNMITMHETSKGNLSPDKLARYQEFIESK